MNKCKECDYFKNGCGFSKVDTQLGLNGDFVGCGQFKMIDVWSFIYSATEILFPDDVNASWNLLVEYRSEGKPWNLYRLYLDENDNRKYARLTLKTDMNV